MDKNVPIGLRTLGANVHGARKYKGCRAFCGGIFVHYGAVSIMPRCILFVILH